jgi:hypothetical protein
MTTFRPLRLFGGLWSKKEVSLKLPLIKVYWEKETLIIKKTPDPGVTLDLRPTNNPYRYN